MDLTKEDLLLAAETAERFPKGRALEWVVFSPELEPELRNTARPPMRLRDKFLEYG